MDFVLRIGCHREWLSGAARSVMRAMSPPRGAALRSGRIGMVGEDVEYLPWAGRPADANETVEAWKMAVAHTEGPVGLVPTRQKLPNLDHNTADSRCGNGKRSLCACRLRRRSAQNTPDRYRFRSVDRDRGAQPTDS
jgi:hypothetical protein